MQDSHFRAQCRRSRCHRSSFSQLRETLLHVDDVMDEVVQEVPTERFDGEQRAVAAGAWTAPLVAVDGFVEVGEGVRLRRRSSSATAGRILQVVALD